MGSPGLLLLLLYSWSTSILAVGPSIRIHSGFISVQDGLYSAGITGPYSVGSPYTFELYMDDTSAKDYIIESCSMNGVQFVGAYGCVQCSNIVLQSVETEQYTLAGAIKRTLVHFNAPATNIQFVCQVKILDCLGCAERSCERRPALIGVMATQIPLSCGFLVAPVAVAPAVGVVGGYAQRSAYPIAGAIGGRDWLAGFPWWLWLLLFLLLLLLLLCCLACLLWACLRSKKRRSEKVVTTRIATAEENKVVGICVGTEPTKVLEKGVGTNGSLCQETIVQEKTERIVPAVVADDGYYSHSRNTRGSQETEQREESFDATYTRVTPRVSVYRERDRRDDHREPYIPDRNAGAYSVREGRVIDERFSRSGYTPSQPSPPHHDRSSYRNYAYQRDMGRVAPMSGFDEVETVERRYCMSDDDSEVVEKDIKRTHTTRFVSETRTVNDDQHSDNSSEKYREEGEQHVVYAPQYRI